MMDLDFGTLTAAGALVAFVSALLLIFAATQYDRGGSALRLGVSHLLAAGAIMLLALSAGGNPIMPLLAQPVFILAGFLALSATLSFEGTSRPVDLVIAIAAALGVLASMILAELPTDWIRVVQLAVIGPLYISAAAVLWRSTGEKLRARIPLAGIFLLHGVVNLVGLVEELLHEALPSGVPSFANWYGIIHVESMIYFIGSTLFLVALLKERSEMLHKSASLTDSLTGLPNRRAFFNAGDRVLERCRRSTSPCCVIAVDFDRFKAINDTYGHAIGDRVLQAFGALVRQQLRPTDVIGRLGGEEFAVVLPQMRLREAAEIGDRLRATFSEAAFNIDGREVRATLSGGIAVAFGDEQTVAEVLERADAALYRAKLNGRDRVELYAESGNVRVVKEAAS